MTGHNCPATGCTLNVSAGKLLCRSHWFTVPKALRDAVWDAWRGGIGAGSPSHRAACADAIEAVNHRIAERTGRPA
jgi:hypothetical protein